jgi:hypothetical protein
VEFNPTIHVSDENGDPVRKEDGELRLRTNWKDLAVDKLGRKYNPRVHDDYKLDSDGFLLVRRRDADRAPMSATNRSEAFVNKYREPGYEYYLMADDHGRQAQFEQHDWEPVMDEDGVATLAGGQGRTPNTELRLMKKPKEWYDEDQAKKELNLKADLKANTGPDESKGQYAPEDSRLK